MDTNQPPLLLQPEVSLYLQVFIVVTHALEVLVVLFLLPLPWWGNLLACAIIAYSARYFWRLHITRLHPASVLEATFYTLANWRIHTPSGSKFATLADSSFLHPWLCVLNLRTQQGKLHSLILLPDSLPADLLRQLRVRVKFSTTDDVRTK